MIEPPPLPEASTDAGPDQHELCRLPAALSMHPDGGPFDPAWWFFGWRGVEMPSAGSGRGLHLRWNTQVAPAGALLRLALMRSSENDSIEARLTSGRVLGVIEPRRRFAYSVLGLPVGAADVPAVLREGVVLRQLGATEENRVMLLGSTRGENASAPGLAPHLLVLDDHSDPYEQFLARMNSPESIDMLGWQWGCVLDGLWQLEQAYPDTGFARSIAQQIAMWFDTDGHPAWRLGSTECTLPFATIPRLYPDHPYIPNVLERWRFKQRSDGAVRDDNFLSAEGSYTTAYPMALIGVQRNRRDLIELALYQHRVRRERLVADNSIYLREYDDGSRTFANWSRGVCWYFLGLVRTLTVLPPELRPRDCLDEARRVARWVLEHRAKGGLWPNLLHESALPPDTSGSAGIAAALMEGWRYGWFEHDARDAAVTAFEEIKQWLTPDGFLDGVISGPGLRTVDPFQYEGHRGVSQMGMGLYAQLAAAVRACGRVRS